MMVNVASSNDTGYFFHAAAQRERRRKEINHTNCVVALVASLREIFLELLNLLEVRIGKCPAILTDHITHPAELVHDFFFTSCCFGGIREVLVKSDGIGWKIRTTFFCIVTDGDDVVKFDVSIFIDQIGSVCGNVNAGFFHDLNGFRIDTMCFHSGAVYSGFVFQEPAEESFSDLTSAAVSCAQNQYVFHTSSHKRLMMVKRRSNPSAKFSVVIPSVMTIGFLYFLTIVFIDQQQPPPGVQQAVLEE